MEILCNEASRVCLHFMRWQEQDAKSHRARCRKRAESMDRGQVKDRVVLKRTNGRRVGQPGSAVGSEHETSHAQTQRWHSYGSVTGQLLHFFLAAAFFFGDLVAFLAAAALAGFAAGFFFAGLFLALGFEAALPTFLLAADLA